MDEIGSYAVWAVTVFFSSFFGNMLAYHIREWYEDRTFYKAFEPLFNRRLEK